MSTKNVKANRAAVVLDRAVRALTAAHEAMQAVRSLNAADLADAVEGHDAALWIINHLAPTALFVTEMVASGIDGARVLNRSALN